MGQEPPSHYTRWIALAGLALLVAGCAGGDPAPVTDRSPGGDAPTHYEVRPGDTLYRIAWEYDLDHQAVARWNDLDSPDTIHVGQRLRLEPPGQTPAPTSRPPTREGPIGGTGSGDATPEDDAPDPEPREGDAEGGRAASGPPDDWLWPADGDVVKPFAADADGKQGIRIGGSHGAAVRASAAGEVVYSGSGLVGYGNLVILKHPGDFLTAYGYNSRVRVEEGDRVEAGDRIADMGNAVGSGEPGLHFELRRDGQPVDPADYLVAPE